MNDVFLSYASEDRERAGRLAQALEARGWSVWWDREILAGQTFDQAIEKQLESARCVLVLWSRASITSEWVKNEAAAAAERGVLTPVKIDEVRLPLEFRRRQTISLVGWNGDDKQPAFAELCLHVGARINGTALPDVNTGSAELLKRPRMWLVAVGLLVVVVALALGAYRTRNSSTAQPGDTANTNQTTQPLALRKTPATLSSDMVKVLLVKNNFYDRNWNPDGKGVANRYEPQIKGNAVVLFDAATGLTWQRGGSRDQISFERAKEYVAGLNAEKYAGFSDWRLPTLEEALSTMEPEARDDLHIDPAFERVNLIWTADPAGEEQEWMIYFYDGLSASEPYGFNASARAVR